MLYDDDHGGPPFEPLDPDDDSQWVIPPVDFSYVSQFGPLDRILIVLAMAETGSDDQFGDVLQSAHPVTASGGTSVACWHCCATST